MSGVTTTLARNYRGSVAGTTVPAFVERLPRLTTAATSDSQSVAGTTVPAFVERIPASASMDDGQVAPLCRRDYGPGLR